jgi:hypothetical protein
VILWFVIALCGTLTILALVIRAHNAEKAARLELQAQNSQLSETCSQLSTQASATNSSFTRPINYDSRGIV